MGGKQRKNRKHFHFYIVCFLIIIFITGGCIVPPKRVHVLPAGGTPFERASVLVSKGKYNDALRAFSKITRSYPSDSPGEGRR